MNIIPILPATIDIITKLNDGVRPELKGVDTYFYVYRGEGEPSSIITLAELDSDAYPEWMAQVSLYYVGT